MLIRNLITTFIIKNHENRQEWVTVLTRRSVPYVSKGVLGFFIITIGLLMIQACVVIVGHELTDIVPLYTFFDSWIFSLIIFYS